MNSVVETILDHRSVRSFTSEKLTTEQIHTIVRSAQMASTSSYVQAYSIIGVTDQAIKNELAEISGQPYVKKNGHMFIFCADLSRIASRANHEQLEKMKPNLENTEHLLVASIDAALAAQNAALAAESMGLGICYIGSIRNKIKKVDELLHLPEHVIPLFGMVMGYPAAQQEQKPRLPIEAIYFENSYNSQQMNESIDNFDQMIQSYYESRTENKRSDNWSSQMIRRFSQPIRMDVSDYLKSKGYNKR